MRAILTYHSLDDSGSPISVAPEEFRRHVAWFATRRVPVLGLEELLAAPPETEAVALTFDDAFANFGAVAAPLLAEHGLPATLFVVAGHVGGTNAWGGRRDRRVPTLPLLDWAALGRLADRGVTIGAHTRSHPHLTALEDAALADELEGANAVFARELGRRPATFAYPYGDVDARVAVAAGRSYRLAVTTELRAVGGGADPLRLPRLDMFYLRAAGRLEAWGTAGFRRSLWVRAQARRARGVLHAVLGGW